MRSSKAGISDRRTSGIKFEMLDVDCEAPVAKAMGAV